MIRQGCFFFQKVAQFYFQTSTLHGSALQGNLQHIHSMWTLRLLLTKPWRWYIALIPKFRAYSKKQLQSTCAWGVRRYVYGVTVGEGCLCEWGEWVDERGCVYIYVVCRFVSECCVYRRRQWHSTPVLCLEKSHGQRSLVGCSPRGC